MGVRGADRWSSGREIYRRYAEYQKELERWGREVYNPIWKKMCQDVLLKGYSEPLVIPKSLTGLMPMGQSGKLLEDTHWRWWMNLYPRHLWWRVRRLFRGKA